MIFDDISIDETSITKDTVPQSSSLSAPAGPKTDTLAGITPIINDAPSSSSTQSVAYQDLRNIIGPFPFEAPAGFHWVPT